MSKWFENLFGKTYKNLSSGDYLGTEKAINTMNKGRTITLDAPKSSRYYFDGDMGFSGDEMSHMPQIKNEGSSGNVFKSGYSNLYTPRQIDESKEENKVEAERTDIKSTAIDKIKYNPKTKVAQVWFVGGNGTGYAFPNVPSEKIANWVKARSKGEYYNDVIKEYSDPNFRGEA